jgi:hypothetical protein
MFLPSNVDAQKQEAEIRKAAFKSIEAWSMEFIPEEIRKEAYVSVQEVVCGDPQCSPIDTAVTITFARYVVRKIHSYKG